MATILLQVAGSALGSFFGGFGTALGSAAGAIGGYLVDRALINSTQRIEGPRLSNATPFSAEEGAPIPRVYGTARIPGTMIWATRFEETRQSSRQGGKGGPKVTTSSYFANVAFALCEGEIACVRRIWADGTELDLDQVTVRVHNGAPDQAPDPLIEAKQGAGNAPAYRGTAYAAFERLPIGAYGNRIPQIQFEVLRPVGDFAASIRAMALIPGATEFGYAPDEVSRRVRPGQWEAVNRHVSFAGSDFLAAMDELQACCPNLERVALVVAWFGDDLRAGECRIRPGVTQDSDAGFTAVWRVSGTSRADALTVSTHAGGAAYGGTPSDLSVIEAIAELKARGLAVVLYPFVMMDIAAGNGLADPYGGAEQAAYPWRGRITCHPAAGQSGTVDRTAAARAQVDEFFGVADAGDFVPETGGVAFTGDIDEWGYRRLVLHYAHLAMQAGGVDGFLIGSELRGLTTIRDEADAYPAVEALCELAADVRGVVGPGCAITYGADWTEYFGHRPQDGSGDLRFHLDALWAHAEIDAVGIDNYMPLADWRDADWDGSNPDGAAGPHDDNALAAAIQGGEGFDWCYASDADRDARIRTPIADGAYGKPWVFRYKDIAGWWGNQHVDRIGGVEAASPTAWVPQSKPVWFTELGCPAVDRGPNQPNVFPDPKSSEHALPHFSDGGRSDAAQRGFLSAHLGFWPTQVGEAANPVSPIYGGSMVGAGNIFLWAWDCRAFPAFPLRSDVWGDGENWLRGHWLNGRIANATAGELAHALVGEAGLDVSGVASADGAMTGFVSAGPRSTRDELEPVLDLFGLTAVETADGIACGRGGAAGSANVIERLVVPDKGNVVDYHRTPDHDLPAELALSFRAPFADYQTSATRAAHERGTGVEALDVAAVFDREVADSLAADLLARRWRERETVEFSLPPGERTVEPGSVVRLDAFGPGGDFLVVEIDDGLVRRVTARRVVRIAPTPIAARLPASAPAAPLAVGAPLVHFLDLPAGATPGEAVGQFRIAAWSHPWRRLAAFASPEASGYVQRAEILHPAIVGELVTPLPAGFSGRFDRVTSVDVLLSGGALSSLSRTQVLNGGNVAAVHSLSGVWEVLQFEEAEEIAADLWRLSGLLRGQLGTEDAALAGAAAGAAFVLLDDALVAANLAAGEAGLPLFWKTGPVGADFSAPLFDERSETGGLRALTPLAPAHLTAVRHASGDLAVTWIRRGRIDADSWLAAEIPLGEEEERYVVEVTAGSAILRTASVTAPAWAYPAADIAADLGAPPAEIVVTVRQMSAAIGPGLPASLSFVID